MRSAATKFKNARACFAQNIESLPQPNLMAPLHGEAALMWNLYRGLHDLTSAIEDQLEDIDSRLSAVEAALQPRK